MHFYGEIVEIPLVKTISLKMLNWNLFCIKKIYVFNRLMVTRYVPCSRNSNAEIFNWVAQIGPPPSHPPQATGKANLSSGTVDWAFPTSQYNRGILILPLGSNISSEKVIEHSQPNKIIEEILVLAQSFNLSSETVDR